MNEPMSAPPRERRGQNAVEPLLNRLAAEFVKSDLADFFSFFFHEVPRFQKPEDFSFAFSGVGTGSIHFAASHQSFSAASAMSLAFDVSRGNGARLNNPCHGLHEYARCVQ